MPPKSSKLTQSVHAGSHGDSLYGGIVNPIYPSAAYDYEKDVLYPRYFNTPNQKAVVEKICALENAQAGLMFGSGMAAIMTSIFGLMKAGDHILFQHDLYGGTHHAAVHELERYGMTYTMADVSDLKSFEKNIRKETRVIFVETPSNPLLKITDLAAIAKIAKYHGILTIIDNTFASPVNQNPIDLGIDVVTHSGTKYIGGHSDLCCGVAVGSEKVIEKIKSSAMHFGGSLDAQSCFLVERSLKTIVLRVRQQNENALAIAKYLETDSRITKVNYPGLPGHPGHRIARKQMPGGFGGMMSFEIKTDPDKFMKKLTYIKRAISLGGVESTMCSPVKTSHVKLTPAERKAVGISDKLIRFSVGIEDYNDLINDIKQAL
jgi:cystathionine beta-lyase/cystathionine gamma-synthase